MPITTRRFPIPLAALLLLAAPLGCNSDAPGRRGRGRRRRHRGAIGADATQRGELASARSGLRTVQAEQAGREIRQDLRQAAGVVEDRSATSRAG